uniref:RHD domain-containing protein n=1 Tax=Esox lucius TaxID=8010 RepID=A0A6Q2XGH1_ESOLU
MAKVVDQADDLDIIQDLISKDIGFPCPPETEFSLPRPTHPPADLDLQPPNCRVKPRMPPSSSPLLVSRGTSSRVNCPVHQHPAGPREMSAHRRGGRVSAGPSRGQTCPPQQGQAETDLLDRILERPTLAVAEQPKERGMRFRYECEGRSAGSILGANSGDSSKTLPAIELQGPIQHIKKVTVTVSLVTKDYPYRPHPHCLVGKDCADGTGICVVSFNPHNNRRHSFANLGIQCVRRKELDASLEKRRSQKIDPFKTGQSRSIEDMDMNVVRLCFQCELEWEDGKRDLLNPVVSNPIYDKKATTTSELKINRLNIVKGPCSGKTEIYMLCDKVQKDDIEIIFKRGSWEAKAEFAQTDVHRQIAIVFKTPPYQEQDVGEEVEVNVFLRRLSDHMDSDPVTFSYQPQNSDPYEVKRKRKIKTDISFTDRSCVAAKNVAAVEAPSSQPFEAFHFGPAESCPALDEMPLPAQPGASTLGEIHYSDPQDDNLFSQTISPEDICTITHLLELYDPTIFSFDQGSNFAQGEMDNVTLGVSGQDLGYYNDVQFNQLVNENQAPLRESAPCLPLSLPGPAPLDLGQCDNDGRGLVQVKTEGEL